MPGFINFKTGGYRWVVPVDRIALINVSSTSSVVVYLSEGKFSSGSSETTHAHKNRAMYNEAITLTTTNAYSAFVGEQLTQLIAAVSMGDFSGYAEVAIDGVEYADFNEVTGITWTAPTQKDLD